MTSIALSSTPKKHRIGGDDAEADRERLLHGDEFSDDDAVSDAQPVVGGGGHITSSSTDPTNRDMVIDEESGYKLEGRPGDNWAWNLALVAAATLSITALITVLWNYNPDLGWFAFHPPLQTLALCCFTYGIMTLQPTSQRKTKVAGLKRHQTAMFYVALPLITLGSSTVMLNKYIKSKDHFTTWHGTFGLFCMLWILGQIFIGAGSVWNGGALFGGGMKAKALWKYHRMSGYVLFPLLLFTAHLGGGWSDWATNNTNGIVLFVAYTIAPIAILISIYSRVRPSKMKFW